MASQSHRMCVTDSTSSSHLSQVGSSVKQFEKVSFKVTVSWSGNCLPDYMVSGTGLIDCGVRYLSTKLHGVRYLSTKLYGVGYLSIKLHGVRYLSTNYVVSLTCQPHYMVLGICQPNYMVSGTCLPDYIVSLPRRLAS
jgi:hypothetical protein